MNELRTRALKRASELPVGHPTRKSLLATLRKRAGKFSMKVFSKDRVTVTAKDIEKAIRAEGGWDATFIDNLDFKNVEWVKGTDPLANSHPPGVEVSWRVFPKGEYGNRDGDYVWGYVYAGVVAENNGITVVALLTVST